MIISQGHGRRLPSVLLSSIRQDFYAKPVAWRQPLLRCARPRAASVNQARCSNELLEHLEHLHETNDLFGNVAKSQNLRICGQRICGQMGPELCSKWWRWQRRAGPAGIHLPKPVLLSTFQTGCFLSFFAVRGDGCSFNRHSLCRRLNLYGTAQLSFPITLASGQPASGKRTMS
jgi:hypothetical protein